MKTTSLKSKAMRNAWVLYRNSGNKFTWSEALTTAWFCVKNEVRAYIRKDARGTIHLNYEKNGKHSDKMTDVIDVKPDTMSVNNSGAEAYYNTGKYQGD